MQVRVFIKPDQVALMLSAGDWLSDSVFVGVCVFVLQLNFFCILR